MSSVTTWFVVADGGSARIIALTAGGFVSVSALASSDARHRSSDLGSDHPGRVFESAGHGRHAIEPRTDPRQHAKIEFARQVAGMVNDGARSGLCARLVLVAPSLVLRAIREALDPGAAAMLAGEHAKDLVKLPEAELRERLQDFAVR
ncbi:MAG TPA: host attachment protein [Aliidongia sp.]|nr:host attachment protein [Aliidongia sp.]